MHVSLPVGSSTLMGSDTTEESAGSLSIGTNFSISIDGESKEHCDELFGKLTMHRSNHPELSLP